MNCVSIVVKDIRAAENKVSVVIKSGSSNDYDNPFYAEDWFVCAFARPDCAKCYEESLGSVCANQKAYQMATISTVAAPPPFIKPSDIIDNICSPQLMDGRVYMKNIRFHGFKATYPHPQC